MFLCKTQQLMEIKVADCVICEGELLGREPCGEIAIPV
jgi:hypothetical protein